MSNRRTRWPLSFATVAMILAATGAAVGTTPAAHADASGRGGDFVPLGGPARPGVEAKVTIRNHSSSPLHVLVDLQGWFADPLPAVPVAPFSRTSVLQATPASGALVGSLEYSYLDNIGRLVRGHQPDPDNFGTVQWTVDPVGEAFSGPPAVAEQADRRLQVAVQNIDTDIWVRTQATPGGASGTWADTGGSMAGAPTLARLADGTLVQFAVDADGRLWHAVQSGVDGPFSSWRSLGDVDLVGTPTVVVVRDGLQIFARDSAGALRTATYLAGGALSGWTTLGGSGLTGSPAVVVYPGFRLRVVVCTADGTVVTKAQDDTGAFPATWEPLGTFVVAGSPAAVLNPLSGRTEVLARAADGGIYGIRETAQGSGVWGDWSRASADSLSMATGPTILTFTGAQGPNWIFVARDSDNQHWAFFSPTGTLSQAGNVLSFAGTPLPAPPA